MMSLQVEVMSKCICHSPNKRPTAQELLQLLESVESSNSARMIAEKDATIQRLHKEALARELEIANLKRLLADASIPSSPDSYSPPM